MPALAYVRQDATVLSKGSPYMGEEVEGTAFFEGKLQQKVYIYIVYIQKESNKDKIRGLSFGSPTVIIG